MAKNTLRSAGAILAIACGDGILKKIAEKKLEGEPPKRICGGKIILNLLHNDGAALGVLRKDQKLLLALNSALVGVAAGKLLTSPQKDRPAFRLGMTLAIGGGLSNLIDRVRRGYVTDYFSIDLGERFEKLKKVVFNLSDFCVFGGCILWCIQHISKSNP